ncbi:unnamed protein product, partial [Rotaria magnacalcarata]
VVMHVTIFGSSFGLKNASIDFRNCPMNIYNF